MQSSSQFRTEGTPRPAPKVTRPIVTYAFSYGPGEYIGRELQVLDRVSAGPFTELYRVWSTTRFAPFLCKILRDNIADEVKHRRALEQEARVLTRITHPNVVRAFPPAEGVPKAHVLTDYVVGASLLDLLAMAPRRRLKQAVAVRIAVGVGAALAAVHATGHLYRDLKPANVLLRDGEPVLIDLGAVYRWREGQCARERVGTDPYMAPEQCLEEPLSPATDVFGLGALTYEMLTGEWPFEEQLMNVFDRKKLRNRFPQIAYEARPVRRRAQGVSPSIDAVVARCLARRPEDRYATVSEASAAFNRALDAEDRIFPDGTGDSAQAA